MVFAFHPADLELVIGWLECAGDDIATTAAWAQQLRANPLADLPREAWAQIADDITREADGYDPEFAYVESQHRSAAAKESNRLHKLAAQILDCCK